MQVCHRLSSNKVMVCCRGVIVLSEFDLVFHLWLFMKFIICNVRLFDYDLTIVCHKLPSNVPKNSSFFAQTYLNQHVYRGFGVLGYLLHYPSLPLLVKL